MLNNYELKKAWHKLVSVKELNERIGLKNGGTLNDSEFAILSMIAFHPTTTIAKLERHPFNANTSLSTIKRAVITLMGEDLITVSHGKDGRERLMSIKEGVQSGMDNYCNIQSVCVLCFIVSMVDDATRIRLKDQVLF